MKVFEDWFDKNREEFYMSDERIAKLGWKAALEWALTQETDLQETELGYTIRKELNDE